MLRWLYSIASKCVHNCVNYQQRQQGGPLPTPIQSYRITLCCTHSPLEDIEHSKFWGWKNWGSKKLKVVDIGLI